MRKVSEHSVKPLLDHPAEWDADRFRENWDAFVENLLKEKAGSLIPARRIRRQIERTPAFVEAAGGWDNMNGACRIDAWRRLLVAAEESCHRVLPVCVQCGECCRMGSPTLHLEDLPLLQSGKIPWDQLITLRRGEPARSPFDGMPFILPEERIKVREKEGLRECVFLVSETDMCSIYSDRPLQCRAQACWDPIPARDTAELPLLMREHIFSGVDVLLEIMAEHERRCGFAALSAAFEELGKSSGANVEEVLRLLSYEEHFREFVSDRFSVPQENMELLLGRSLARMAEVFGLRVTEGPDGTRCLVMNDE